MSKYNIVQAYFKERGDSDFKTGPYSFKNDIKGIKVGDLVIAETKYGPNLAKITKLVNPNELYRNADINPKKRILVKVNLDSYYKDLEKEKTMKELENMRNQILVQTTILEDLESKYNKLAAKISR